MNVTRDPYHRKHKLDDYDDFSCNSMASKKLYCKLRQVSARYVVSLWFYAYRCMLQNITVRQRRYICMEYLGMKIEYSTKHAFSQYSCTKYRQNKLHYIMFHRFCCCLCELSSFFPPNSNSFTFGLCLIISISLSNAYYYYDYYTFS